jgi:hypothetical protein
MGFTLSAIYWVLLVPLRIAAFALRRDPLQLRCDVRRDSYWIDLPRADGAQHYYSQRSAAEDRPSVHRPRSVARWLVPLYLRLARWWAPQRSLTPADSVRQKPLEHTIPDETYTLW